MGEAAYPAILAGELLEVEIRVGIRLARVRLHAVMVEKGLTDQVGRATLHLGEPQVDARLAEVDRQQLGVAVGVVHEADVAEGGQLVEVGRRPRAALGRVRRVAPGQAEAGRAGDGQGLEELSASHGHNWFLHEKTRRCRSGSSSRYDNFYSGVRVGRAGPRARRGRARRGRPRAAPRTRYGSPAGRAIPPAYLRRDPDQIKTRPVSTGRARCDNL